MSVCVCVMKEVWREGGAIVPLQMIGNTGNRRAGWCLFPVLYSQMILTLILTCEVLLETLGILGDTSIVV